MSIRDENEKMGETTRERGSEGGRDGRSELRREDMRRLKKLVRGLGWKERKERPA